MIYNDYAKDRIGWFFGLSGWQLAAVTSAATPALWSLHHGAWAATVLASLAWVAVFVIVVAPVKGRSAAGWTAASASFAVADLRGWSRFRSAAARGSVEDLDQVDLPGVLQSIQIHDAPPRGVGFTRVAIIQDHGSKTWAVTAALNHPGIGMAEVVDRLRLGTGLADLLDVASRTELVDEVLFVVRTLPDDGAERALWLARHRTREAVDLAREVNDDLEQTLTAASVRTEAYVTVVVPETRIAKAAKECGGGLAGRARVLSGVMNEVEAQLRWAMSMSSVTWLTSPQLAVACRTGFAPGDRVGVVAALATRHADAGVNPDVPWAMAGPSGADSLVRHYSHDAWNSVSAAISLPAKGAAMGALAPVLTTGEPQERRCLLVAFPILGRAAADRRSANSEWAADVATHLRAKAGVWQRAAQRLQASRAHGMDAKLARGHAMTRPYAVCTVTVPKSYRASEFGRRLDASIRRAGFAPLRLDLAHDVAFAASVIPMGVSLTRRGDA